MAYGVGTGLKHSATAYFTLPASFGMKLAYLTDDEIVARFLQLWTESLTFLNSIAPHGYIIQSIQFSPQRKVNTFRVTINLLVNEADHRHIMAEWNTAEETGDGQATAAG